jgi:hypothetical protein
VFGFNNYYQNNYSVWGTEWKVTLTRAFSILAETRPKIILESNNSIENIKCGADDQFINQIKHFCNGIEDNTLMDTWRNDALNQAKTLDIIRKNSGDDYLLKNVKPYFPLWCILTLQQL